MAFPFASTSLLGSRSSNITISPLTGFVSSSLDPLPPSIRDGMIAMGVLGLISTISTFVLFVFITYRMVYWRKYYDRPIAENQVFVLIYNLLLADFQQALSFLISFHWIAQNKLVGPSPACFAQGWLIQIGDVSSGLFVLAIALHTFVNLVARKLVPMGVFIGCVVGLWVFCLVLTAIGPLMRNQHFFVPAGAWCWINEEYTDDRLYLHYLWIFISQLGSIVVYSSIFVFLRMQLASNMPPSASSSAQTPNHGDTRNNDPTTTTITTPHQQLDTFAVSRKRILRTARYMVVYPCAYVALTLPLAAGRVSAMAGTNPPLVFYCVAGTLMASCGVTDVVLYMSTRKALVKSSVGKKRHGNNPTSEGPLSRFRTRASKRKNIWTGSVRMDDLVGSYQRGRGKMPHGNGAIFVSKSVTRSEETDDAMSMRSSSLKSLVGMERAGESARSNAWMV